jgi:hypothetical protein
MHQSVSMSPFMAALLACLYMATVFAIFGLGPRLRGKTH